MRKEDMLNSGHLLNLSKKSRERLRYLDGDAVGYRLPEVEFTNFTLSPACSMLGQ